MLFATTKLKRVKVLQFSLNSLLFIVASPFYVLYFIGKFSGFIIENILSFLYWLQNKISVFLKWDDVAKKQYDNNPQKFE